MVLTESESKIIDFMVEDRQSKIRDKFKIKLGYHYDSDDSTMKSEMDEITRDQFEVEDIREYKFEDIKDILKASLDTYNYDSDFFMELLSEYFPYSQTDISHYTFFKYLLSDIYNYYWRRNDKYVIDFILQFLRNNNYKTLFDNGFSGIFETNLVDYSSYISGRDSDRHICKTEQEKVQVAILDFLVNDTKFDFKEKYKEFIENNRYILCDLDIFQYDNPNLKYAIENNYIDRLSINVVFRKLLPGKLKISLLKLFNDVLNYTKIEDDFKPTIIMNSELFSAPYKIMYFFKRACFVFKQNKFTSDCIKYLLDNFLTSNLDKHYIKHTIIPEIESKTEVEMDKGSKSNLLELLKST